MPRLSGLATGLTLLVALASLCISFRSCSVSEQANSIANNARKEAKTANEIAERAFTVAHRPQLVVAPVKSSKTGKYVNQQVVDGQVVFEVGYEVKNVGGSPAATIAISYAMELSSWTGEQPAFQVQPAPAVISLAPGEGRVMLVQAAPGVTAEEILAWTGRTPDWRLLTHVSLDYRWDDVPDVAYATSAAYCLQENRAETLGNTYSERRLTDGESP
jgi:hypothetical protein